MTATAKFYRAYVSQLAFERGVVIGAQRKALANAAKAAVMTDGPLAPDADIAADARRIARAVFAGCRAPVPRVLGTPVMWG